MKIGILTFQQAINYGAVLQLYALQRIVSDCDVAVEIINYISPKLTNDYKIIKVNDGLKAFLASLLTAIANGKKKHKFGRFVNRVLNLTKPVFDKEELGNLSKSFDYIITGSDQVWNYQITEEDNTYLLFFVEPHKRLSYAASFGVNEIPDFLKETYTKLLVHYKYITVREKQGANLVQELCDRDVPVVLDPTLLLNKQDWKEITENVTVDKRRIVVYTLSRSDLLMNIADKLSKDTGFDIAVINPRLRYVYSKTSAYTSGPEEFVSLFMNAEYVLTNSFHGTAFAINFNKKFLVELPGGEHGKLNSRIENILELLNLKERCVETLDLDKMYVDIDWEKVNKILHAERNKSIGHLKKMIGKNE